MSERRFTPHMRGTVDDTSLASQRGATRFVVPAIVGLALLLAVGFSLLASDKERGKGDPLLHAPASIEHPTG